MSNRWTPETVISEAYKSEKFLTVLDVASLLNVRPSTVYQWVNSEEIPHYRLGRIVRFRKKDLEAWVRELQEGEDRCREKEHGDFRDCWKKRQRH